MIPDRQSVVVGVLVVTAVIGFGIGSVLGTTVKETGVTPAVSPTPVPSALARPSVSRSPDVSPSVQASQGPPLGTILEVSGTSDEVTSSVDVQSGWQIVWQTDGEMLAIAVRGDQDLGTIVNQTGSASGAISLSSAGTFHLEVTARGPWSIKVLQGGGPA